MVGADRPLAFDNKLHEQPRVERGTSLVQMILGIHDMVSRNGAHQLIPVPWRSLKSMSLQLHHTTTRGPAAHNALALEGLASAK